MSYVSMPSKQRTTLVSAAVGREVETWEWDANIAAWSQVADTGCSVEEGFDLAWDSKRGELVMFGGRSGSDARRQTWIWDLYNWVQRADIGPARAYHTMAFDEDHAQVVLYGGGTIGRQEEAVSVTLNRDTWVWDGAHWTQVQDMGPQARQYHCMAYNHDFRRVVMFGGNVVGGPLTNREPGVGGLQLVGDTWEWNEY
jgi:hypothetical protein